MSCIYIPMKLEERARARRALYIPAKGGDVSNKFTHEPRYRRPQAFAFSFRRSADASGAPGLLASGSSRVFPFRARVTHIFFVLSCGYIGSMGLSRLRALRLSIADSIFIFAVYLAPYCWISPRSVL